MNEHVRLRLGCEWATLIGWDPSLTLAIVVLCLAVGMGGGVLVLRAAHRRRVQRQLAAGERAALVASLGQDAFDSERLEEAVDKTYAPVARRLNFEDRALMVGLFGEPAVDELLPPVQAGATGLSWVRLPRDPSRGVVAVREAEQGRRAEVTVRLEARARIWVGPFGYWPPRLISAVTFLVFQGLTLAHTQALETYLTFALKPGSDEWVVTSIEPGESGRHHLERDPTGEGQRVQRLRDEAVLALAAEAPAASIPEEVAAALPRETRAATRELETLDDRFGEEVIAACVRRILDLYALASEGDPGALDAVASARAASYLLRRRGWALRGPQLKNVRVLAVRADRTPPEISVGVAVEAWYGPRGELDSDPRFWGYGTRRSEQTFWWQLASDGPPQQPWRLVGADLNRFRLTSKARRS